MKTSSIAAVLPVLGFIGAANADTVIATEGFVRSGVDNAKAYADTVASGKQNMIGNGAAGTVITNTGSYGIVGAVAVDEAATESSENLITSGAVYDAVTTMAGGSQQVLSGTPGSVATYSSTDGALGETDIDTTPTVSSSNLITSNAVYAGLAAKQNVIAGGPENIGKVIVGTESGYEWGSLTPDYYSDSVSEVPLAVEGGPY